jgi:phosphopantothenate synthetase
VSGDSGVRLPNRGLGIVTGNPLRRLEGGGAEMVGIVKSDSILRRLADCDQCAALVKEGEFVELVDVRTRKESLREYPSLK